MATNKNQHFVPKAHFKPFTLNSDGAAINLFNVDSMRVVANAPVKNQCSRDYFYGKDQRLDDAIQAVEGRYASCITELSAGAKLSDVHELVLRRFAYLQHLRTEAVAKVAAQQSIAMSEFAELNDIPSLRDATLSAVQVAMSHFAETMEWVDDLKVRIIRNKTNVPFLTSDDPSILVNRFYSASRKTIGLSFGCIHAGAVFFLPLTPTLSAVLFDGDIYSIVHCSGFVDLTSVGDVWACNELQALHCACNIYFTGNIAETDLKTLFEGVSDRRVMSKFEVFKAALESSDGNVSTYVVRDDVGPDVCDEALIHIKSVRPKVVRWPSFLKFRNPKVGYFNDSQAGYIRRSMVHLHMSETPWRKLKL